MHTKTYKIIKKRNTIYQIAVVFLAIMTSASCVKDKDLYQGGNGDDEDDEEDPNPPSLVYSAYAYPFGSETQNATIEITFQTNKEINPEDITAEIPYLKYNKSWLLMLTQDDCKHAAYCRTWAAINGKPVSSSELYPTTPNPHDLYYDAAQLQAGDLPPTIIPAGRTLGSTNGLGNEVRFAITTTLAPELEWMNAETNVNPGFKENYYRFYMKSGLVWDNIIEMLNYGTGIAFHDVEAPDVNDPAEITKHYAIAQNIIREKLSGRGAKMLAEPNGNKTYVTAALEYPEIQTMVAQSGTVRLYPFKVSGDLKEVLLHRVFNDNPEYFKNIIETELQQPVTEREAIHIGVHGTDNNWVELLNWINNTYGKDGDDSVWFPSQEEYYEYNYYRTHASLLVEKTGKQTFKLIVELPSEQDFYYPSVSINLKGLSMEDIVSVSSNEVITGLTYGSYGEDITLNLDCRKHLAEQAEYFVEKYQKDKSDLSKSDALYFVNMLKESPKKEELLESLAR